MPPSVIVWRYQRRRRRIAAHVRVNVERADVRLLQRRERDLIRRRRRRPRADLHDAATVVVGDRRLDVEMRAHAALPIEQEEVQRVRRATGKQRRHRIALLCCQRSKWLFLLLLN